MPRTLSIGQTAFVPLTAQRRPRTLLALVLASAGWLALGPGPVVAHAEPAPPATPTTPTTPTTTPASVDREHWFEVELMGQHVGWLHTTVTSSEQHIVSESRTQITIERGPMKVAIKMSGSFVETVDGKPVSMSVTQQLGATTTEQFYDFKPDGIHLRTRQGGRETASVLPLPGGEWLPPAAADREAQRRFEAGEKTFSIASMEPTNGPTVVTSTRSIVGPTTLELHGQRVPAIETVVESSTAPGVKNSEFVDERGDALLSKTTLGTLDMTMRRAERAVAQRRVQPAPQGQQDVMVRTFVTPDRRIANARATSEATFVVSTLSGELPALPDTPSQRVERLESDRARLSISTQLSRADADADRTLLLRPSKMLDTTDPAIIAFVQEALAQHADKPARERAEVLRRAVHRAMRGSANLGVAFATASEVAKTRSGDCTEFAVFLAACLRTAGIPARVATGLIYADQFAGQRNIFGYHMWTQALVEDADGRPQWIELDATLPEATPFDATHITLALSTLNDDEQQAAMNSAFAVIGNLAIEVEHVGYANPDDAP